MPGTAMASRTPDALKLPESPQRPAHPGSGLALDDVGQGTRRPGLRLVYGFSHGSVLSVRRRDGVKARRAHSRLGGAAVLSGHG